MSIPPENWLSLNEPAPVEIGTGVVDDLPKDDPIVVAMDSLKAELSKRGFDAKGLDAFVASVLEPPAPEENEAFDMEKVAGYFAQAAAKHKAYRLASSTAAKGLALTAVREALSARLAAENYDPHRVSPAWAGEGIVHDEMVKFYRDYIARAEAQVR